MTRFLTAVGLVVVAIVLLGGCATGYQSTGFTGGYEHTRLDENVFVVNFRGNGYTSTQRAADFAMLRAAELSQQYGYPYFVVADSSTAIRTSTYTTPTQSTTTGQATFQGNSVYGSSQTTTYGGQTYNINKPGVTLVIVALPDRPQDGTVAMNAQFVGESIRQKYGL